MDPNQPGSLVTDAAVNPYAAPTSNVAPAPEIPPNPVRAARIAGAMMLAAAPAGLISAAGERGAASYVAVAIDVLIGISLASGNLKYRVWAVLRCVVGLLFYGGTSLAKGDASEAIGMTAYVGSLLLLLIGTPGKTRTIIGAVASGLLAVLTYVVLLVGGGAD